MQTSTDVEASGSTAARLGARWTRTVGWFGETVDGLIPEVDTWHFDLRVRARLTFTLSCVFASLAPVAFLGNFVLGQGLAFSVGIGAVVLALATPALLLRRTGWTNASSLLLCELGLVSCVVLSFFYGGVRSPVTLSLGLVPLMAVAICEPRSALFVWFQTVSALIAMYVAGRSGLVPNGLDLTPRALDRLWLWNQLLFEVFGAAIALFSRWTATRVLHKMRAVTDRLDAALDEAREATKRAGRLAEVRASFLANMSHEIRTPLNGIVGMSELLVENDDAREREEFAATLRRSAHALARVLDDVLELSKLEAGGIQLEALPVSTRELVHDAALTMQEAARAKGIQLDVECEPGVPLWVSGDVTRLRQVISNLLSNAVKFTSEGFVSLRLVRAGEDIALEVEDTGVGIPADKLDVIFESFQQADISTTRRFGGTGLGLTITRHLVRAMGGDVAVESRVGVGTTFRCRLPLRACEPPTVVADTSGPQDRVRRSLYVLVAEDNPVNSTVVLRMLQRLGHRAKAVADGRSAVAEFARGDFDVIFMDWQMPDMDGLAATVEIRQSVAGARVPILAMTANVLPDQWRRCRDAGMDALLVKPLTLSALRRALVDVQTGGLSGERAAVTSRAS
jgi:signal transduction histidine kinase/ActR/RegA family two-component response regulator